MIIPHEGCDPIPRDICIYQTIAINQNDSHPGWDLHEICNVEMKRTL